MQESISASQIKQLLLTRFEGGFVRLSDIPDPALLKDASKAAERIVKSIKSQERITVVGDYDVDGVTSTSIMIDFFKRIGYPLTTIIPNRFNDGYGISPKILDRIDADLIITVDNGISAIEAAQTAKERGMDLIITDHHTPGERLPDAYAIVDPKLSDCGYPFKEICGAQVAWLVLALVKKGLKADVDMGSFLDLLAIAIIADVMPLIGINRVMVQKGLELMGRSERPAIKAMRAYLDKEVLTSEDIGFQIAPRINSAGRMEDASYAVDFLAAQSEQDAFIALERLDRLNTFRKDVEANATNEAMAMVNPEAKVIIVAKESWHEGVVGIVAARLVDHFQKPAMVLAIENGSAKGSARSIGDVNLHTMLTTCEVHLDKYGGHKMAAGLSLKVENLDPFKEAVNAYASGLEASMFIPKNDVLGELYAKDITYELLEMIESFQPFGEGNPRPKFLMKEVRAKFVKRFGQDSAHLRFSIESPHEQYGLGVVGFRNRDTITEGQRVSLSYTLNKNEYNGRISIQLMLDKLYY